jgi:peptidoglycan hydrolase FlgJ
MPAALTGLLSPLWSGGDEAARIRQKSPRDIARDFEALLVTQMIAAMRKTLPTSGLLEPSAARRMLDGAFDHELARALVDGGGLGVAQQIEARIAGGALRASALRAHGTAAATAEARVEPAAEAAGVTSDIAVRASAASPALLDAADDLAAPLQVPVDGRLTSGFGVRRDPFTGERRFHQGVDLAAPRGAPIRVAADGEVVFSGRRGRAGNVVEVRHADGLVTSYAHAERLLVVSGQKVGVGDVIATVGSSGRSTGPHLHFTARVDGQVIDPTKVLPTLGGRPVAG